MTITGPTRADIEAKNLVARSAEGQHPYRTDLLEHGRKMLDVCHPSRSDEAEAMIADAVADLCHLAASLDVDPDEALAHGRSYYESDLQGPLL